MTQQQLHHVQVSAVIQQMCDKDVAHMGRKWRAHVGALGVLFSVGSGRSQPFGGSGSGAGSAAAGCGLLSWDCENAPATESKASLIQSEINPPPTLRYFDF